MSERQTGIQGRRNRYRPRPAVAASLVLSLVLACGAAVLPWTARAGDPSVLGQFNVYDVGLEFTPIHAALLRTGKVWLGAGSGNEKTTFQAGDFRSYVWDPVVAGAAQEIAAPWDLFCAGQTFLANGKLLIAGGTKDYPVVWPGTVLFEGSRLAYTFDPITETYKKMPRMAGGRWYPTLVTLGNGRVYAFAGLNGTADDMNKKPEIFNPAGPSWQAKPTTDPWPMYPHLFLTENGRLFYSGGNVFPAVFNITLPPAGFLNATTSALVPVSGLSQPDNRDQSATVMLPPVQSQRVMIMGGGAMMSNGTLDNVDIIDLDAANPHYVAGPHMIHARMHLNAVLLPNRTVFVTGGANGREMDPVYESEIYNPRTNNWSQAATSRIARMYHSFALLLPDGRVLVGGSNPPEMEPELRLELYSPPYLFGGTRPVINQAPSQASYGSTIQIQTTQANSIKWVSLIRPSAVTHSVDTEQRVVDVPAKRIAPGVLQLKLTGDHDVAPPGWYMLFVTNDDGVPSEASWIKLG
jgi:hypothetical protein